MCYWIAEYYYNFNSIIFIYKILLFIEIIQFLLFAYSFSNSTVFVSLIILDKFLNTFRNAKLLSSI